MSGSHAATPDELDSMATCLGNQSTATESIISTVTSRLANTAWSGPGREAFDAQWEGSFKKALTSLIAALEGASSECTTRAANTRVALG